MSAESSQAILLVEDDDAHTELIRRSFEDAGLDYVLRVVSTLKDAEEILASEEIDLVLTDFLLPDGRGIEVLDWEGAAGLPIVVLTSHGDESVAVEAMKAGALDYVVKSPETFSEMPHLVRRSLREWNHITERARLEKELRQSQKLEAIGRLSSGIAHDFNNLLMAIIGCSELALRKLDEDHPARKFVEAVRDSANRGSSLSNQLVTFSRKKEISPETFELNDMLDQSRRLMQPLLGEEVNFRMRLSPEPLTVHCDRSQLEQVVLNLIVNARDAMPQGGAITLRTGRTEIEETGGALEPGDYVTLVVRDEGMGMSEETQSRAFEPFFTTKPVGKGTGLGLSSAYGIIKQASGEISIDSELGEGTSITICLPVAQSEISLAEISELPEGPATGSETVLVIEDDELVRLALASYLRHAGYSVFEAGDARQALELAREKGPQFDLVLSDVMLPGDFDGPGTVKRLHELGYRVPSVFVSARSSEQLIAEGRLAEGQKVLRKPVGEVELLKHIRKALDEDDTSLPEEVSAPTEEGRRVLFVEDHELSRTTSTMLLSDAGFQPVAAASGREALEAVQAHDVDVVIVDLGLPDMGGTALVRKLRKIREALPALFISGRAETDPAVKDALELGDSAFLPKPFDFDDLVDLVEQLGRSSDR